MDYIRHKENGGQELKVGSGERERKENNTR